MALNLNISGRNSIHRDATPGSPITANIRTSDSEQELSDSFDESPIENQSQKAKLKTRNQSVIDNSSLTSEGDSADESTENKSTSDSGYKLKFIIIILTLFIAVAAIYVKFSKNEQNPKKVCSFKELQKKYPKEGEYLWNHLQFGNEDILNNESEKPAVFLFVHRDKAIAEKLINEIALTSSRCFDSSPIIKNIDFSSNEAIEDYGHIIATYKETIKEGNVILLAYLNEVPGEAAKALHAICDTVTPLVKKVIILLLLTAERKTSDEKVIDTAENALNNLWKDKIMPNELDPIITRVTDQVFLLQSFN